MKNGPTPKNKKNDIKVVSKPEKHNLKHSFFTDTKLQIDHIKKKLDSI